MNLSGKKAFVTGGSSGIGLATARALVDAGCTVAINGRNEKTLRKRAEELGCDWIAGDVGIEAEAMQMVESFVERHGSVDILINNAGIGIFASLVELQSTDFEAVLRTNVLGAFYMAREVARRMIPARSGIIVNVASTAGTKGFQGGTAYAASKFALRGMNECWREELRRQDVKVILINPSEVITDFARRAGYDQEASEKKLRPVDIASAIVAALSMDDRALLPEFAVFATNPF